MLLVGALGLTTKGQGPGILYYLGKLLSLSGPLYLENAQRKNHLQLQRSKAKEHHVASLSDLRRDTAPFPASVSSRVKQTVGSAQWLWQTVTAGFWALLPPSTLVILLLESVY